MTRGSRSLQEEVVAELSSHLLGSSSLFLPDHYGKYAREPADVAWIAGRCAILMYMTEGRGSFEKKKRHNLAQLHGWLRAWKSGEPLKGTSAGAAHMIAFADVDHVIGLSVVDGGEVWCEYHPDQIEYSNGVLTACATITGEVLRHLIKYASGPRDFLFWLGYLRHQNPERVTPNDFVEGIRYKALRDAEQLRAEFGITSFSADEMNADWRYVRAAFGKGRSAGYSIPIDLTSKDIAWFGVAYSVGSREIALPGQTGPVIIRRDRPAPPYVFTLIVCANLRVAAENPDMVVIKENPGIVLITALEFGRDAPAGMFYENPLQEPTLFERELAAFNAPKIGSVAGS